MGEDESHIFLGNVTIAIKIIPKPNIIIFDEVTGKVSNDNLDRLGMFFEKLKTLFEHIWVISHNPYVQDWADNIVRVEKTGNISKVLEVNE